MIVCYCAPVNGNIKALRRAKGLSMKALSGLSGVAQSTIYRIENLLSNPHPSTIRRLAEALDVKPEELMREHGRLEI